jgi:ribosomal protein S10
MTKYTIKLYSKDKKSLEDFLKLFRDSKSKVQNFQIVLKTLKKQKRKKKITILKSPHVNKKAQTQFQLTKYQVIIECFSWEIKKNTILLKKIKNYLFPGIKIKIKKKNFSSGKNITQDIFFNPENTKYHNAIFLKKTIKYQNLLKQTLIYLRILDNYGSF